MRRWLLRGTIGCLATLGVVVFLLFVVIWPISARMAWSKETEFPTDIVVYQLCGSQLFIYEGLAGRRRIAELAEGPRVLLRTPALRSDLGALAYWRVDDATQASLVVQYFDKGKNLQLHGPPQVLKRREMKRIYGFLNSQNLAWSPDGQFLACYTYWPQSSLCEPERIHPVMLEVYESGTNRCVRSVWMVLLTSVRVPPYWTEQNEIAVWQAGEGLRSLSPYAPEEAWDFTQPVIPPIALVNDSAFYFDFLGDGKKCGLYEWSPGNHCPVHRMGWHRWPTPVAATAPGSGQFVYISHELSRPRKGLQRGHPVLVDVRNRTVSGFPEEVDWCSIAGFMTP